VLRSGWFSIIINQIEIEVEIEIEIEMEIEVEIEMEIARNAGKIFARMMVRIRL
jgi:hypothetical protein